MVSICSVVLNILKHCKTFGTFFRVVGGKLRKFLLLLVQPANTNYYEEKECAVKKVKKNILNPILYVSSLVPCSEAFNISNLINIIIILRFILIYYNLNRYILINIIWYICWYINLTYYTSLILTILKAKLFFNQSCTVCGSPRNFSLHYSRNVVIVKSISNFGMIIEQLRKRNNSKVNIRKLSKCFFKNNLINLIFAIKREYL